MQAARNVLLVAGEHACEKPVLQLMEALSVNSPVRLMTLRVLERSVRSTWKRATGIAPADPWQTGPQEVAPRSSASERGISSDSDVEVVREVLTHQPDLVIVAYDRTSAHVNRVLFGSTIGLLRKCACPVWVTKPGQDTLPCRVMAAVKPMATHTEHQRLNENIMQTASWLARIEGHPLHVVAAWLPLTEPISVFGRVPLADPKLVAEVRQDHEAALSGLLRRTDLEGLRVQGHLVRGESHNVIPALAGKNCIDVIVMGAMFHSGMRRLFVRPTSEKVIRKVDCSVFTVRPRAFTPGPGPIDGKETAYAVEAEHC